MYQIPTEFGGSWEAFSRDWALGTAIAYSPAQAARGLSQLGCLWPERLAAIAAQTGRGVTAVVPAIHLGLLLDACSTARHFQRVLARLKAGERSAYSEIVVGGALLSLGYEPQLEAPSGSNPDVHCVVDGTTVTFEVYCPEQSYDSQERAKLVDKLQTALCSNVSRCRVEAAILDVFADSDIASAVEVAQCASPATWTAVAKWARIRRIDQGQDLPPLFDNSDGAQVAIAGDVAVQGESTSATIRWEDSDSRAERALEGKREQLVRRAQTQGSVPSIVVINAVEVGGMGEWPEAISRLRGVDYFQIGIVAFFDQWMGGPPQACRTGWRMVLNPSAELPIPAVLIERIESLDETSHLGIPRKHRLIMS